MNPVLTRQAARWKRQAEAGEMPDEVYEFIAEGATGIEKRQIINLSKVSRIISDEGDLRKYNDFKHDWSFHRSVYDKTKTNTCGLCGKHPINERCIIVDEKVKKEFIVGNSCVLRYLEINIDGKILNDDEKEEFIKENTKKAKKEFKKADFSQRYPTAMSDLKKFEPWMKETAGREIATYGKKKVNRIKYVRKPLASLHKKATRRILTHGFLGPALFEEWEEFMEDAHQQFQVWSEAKAEAQAKAQAKAREAERKALQTRQKVMERWNKGAKMAEEFEAGIEKSVGDDIHTDQYIIRRLKSGSIDVEQWSSPRMRERYSEVTGYRFKPTPIENKLQIIRDMRTGGVSWSDWESKFLLSIEARLRNGSDLTLKQNDVFTRMRSKHRRESRS